MSPPATSLDLARLSPERFAGRLGQAFTLVHRGQSQELTLAAVKANPDGAGPDSERTPFSLIFHAHEDSERPLQRLRELTADLHGLEDGSVAGVLVVRILRPVGLPPGAYYQVAFA